MASLYLLAQPTAKMRLFYTIDKAVGRGRPNQRDDVALVQFFLRAVLEDSKEYKVPAGPSLAIDGVCGSRTIEYINSWQGQEAAISGGVMRPVQDGQVSPALNRAGFGSISKVRYTIVALNTLYAFTAGVDKHSNIALDPRCPVNLLPSIFWK